MTAILAAWSFIRSPVGLVLIGVLATGALLGYVYHKGRQAATDGLAIDANKQKDEARREREKVDSDTRRLDDDALIVCLRDPSKCR